MFQSGVNTAMANQMSQNTMVEHLGIEFIEVGEDYMKAKMPVDHRTKQPMGLLHGGASVALAETLGSFAAHCVVDQKTQCCVGLEINANHVKAVKDGWVYAIAKALHIGKNTHIWEIKVTNEEGALVCVSRITMAVMTKK